MLATLLKTLAVSAAVALTASAAPAQPGRGPGMGMPRYDASTEVTLHGTIEAVQSHEGRMPMMGMGTHLTLKTESGNVDVHVGPAKWLDEHDVKFVAGDRLDVLGSSVMMGGEKAVIAREITKGDRKITLRDAGGRPVWAGRGARSKS